MELCTVSLEAHRHSATIYVMGLLGDLASLRASTLIALVPSTTRTVRLDLRAVEYIDPSAFVGLARALNRWRDDSGGRVTIEFPARSRRRAPHLHLVRQPNSTGTAVNTAMSWPMSTSPG
jgi:ABC-type transporter Mla MlaB component